VISCELDGLDEQNTFDISFVTAAQVVTSSQVEMALIAVEKACDINRASSCL